MDEVLNELGLPNEVGFEISKNTIRSLLTSESYERLIDVVKVNLIKLHLILVLMNLLIWQF